MKKIMMLSALFTVFGANATSVDRGKITEIYTNNAGHVGIKINTGFKDAEQNGECPGYNGWVGLYDPHPNLLKTIYQAHKTNADVTVVTDGCEGATWTRLSSIYLKTPAQ